MKKYSYIILVFFLLSFLFLFFKDLRLMRRTSANKSVSLEIDVVEKTPGAFDALQFWNESRAFPFEDIPPGKYYIAFEKSKRVFGEKDKVGLTDDWTNIGPNNIGGRTLAIALDPYDTSIVWLGSASGGLWKSTTGGIGTNAWTQIKTFGIPTLGVSSILIDSIDPGVMYIGTGETYNYQNAHYALSIRTTRGSYGVGILKTTNGGLNWFKSLDWSYQQNRGVWDILINPKNRNILYAATTEGVYKSYNKGGSWIKIFDEIMVMDLAIDRIDTNVVYAGVGNMNSPNPGIYKTTNSGGNWLRLSNGLPSVNYGRTTITTYHENPNIVMAAIGHKFSTIGLYRSTNQGNTWTQMSDTIPDFLSYQGWYAEGVLIKSDDANQVLVNGVNFYKSTNGGSGLVRKNTGARYYGHVPPGGPEGSPTYMHVDQHDIISNPLDPNKVYIATDGGLFRSNDFGETFYGCNGGFITTQFYGGFSNSFYDSTIALGGLQDNQIAKYTGTSTWYKTSTGDGVMTAINSINHDIMFGCSQYLEIYRSTNQGAVNSWVTVYSASSSEANFIAPLVMNPSHPNVLFAGTKEVLKSTNSGISGSWISLSPPLDGNKILSIAVSYTSPDTLYAATVPTNTIPMGFFRSDGIFFTNISASLPNRYPTDIAVNPRNSKEVYAVFSGFDTSHVFKSTNGGDNWIDINGNLPDVPCQSIVVDPDLTNYIYLGNDLGVYVSSNSGTNWMSFNDGFSPAVMVFDLTISKSNRKLRAATHGNGVFQRSLLGNVIGISKNNELPGSFILYQNYPNPFNPSTTIQFDLPYSSHVTLIVYDLLGREVDKLINGNLPAARHTYVWKVSGLASGIYFYKIITTPVSGVTESYESVKKMVFLK